MNNYYANTNPQPSGDHEVHKDGCTYMPTPVHRRYLGYYSSCREAVKEAKKYYPTADGCFYCSKECHTR